MPSWLHRTDKTYLHSVAENDLPESAINYIEEPNLSEVIGFDSQYWIITGDSVGLMDQASRDAVDAAFLEISRDSSVSQLDLIENILRSFMLVMKDEINILRAQHGLPARTNAHLRTAIRGMLGL